MIGMTTPLTQELLSRGFAFYNKVDAYLNIITVNLKKWILKRYNTFCTLWPILLRDFVVVVSLAFYPNFSLITMNGEGLQMLTHAEHSNLACHTYCVMGHPFIMITYDLWHSHLLLNVWQWSSHYPSIRIRPVVYGIRTPNLPLATLIHCVLPYPSSRVLLNL